MEQPMDWEAEIQEIRMKATAAARHSERILGGVSEMLTTSADQERRLFAVSKTLSEIVSRLGSLEAVQEAQGDALYKDQPKTGQPLSAGLLCALVGFVAGVVLSVAFFGS